MTGVLWSSNFHRSVQPQVVLSAAFGEYVRQRRTTKANRAIPRPTDLPRTTKGKLTRPPLRCCSPE
jgi:hypothetical protein